MAWLALASSALLGPPVSAPRRIAARHPDKSFAKTVEHVVFSSSQRPLNGAKEHAEPKPVVRGLAAMATVLQKLPAAATVTAATICVFPEAEAAFPLFVSLPILAEAAHHLTASVGSRAFRGKSQTLPERKAEEQLELWRQCLDDPTISAEDFIRGWFLRAEKSARPASGDELTVALDVSVGTGMSWHAAAH